MFIKAYESLVPVLQLLGPAFYFVEKDIIQKLAIIKKNQANKLDLTNIVDFCNWEIEENSYLDKSSTSMNLLRLNRALNFINVCFLHLNFF